MPNYIEHRLRLADLVRRTRYFVVDIANSDFPEKAAASRSTARASSRVPRVARS